MEAIGEVAGDVLELPVVQGQRELRRRLAHERLCLLHDGEGLTAAVPIHHVPAHSIEQGVQAGRQHRTPPGEVLIGGVVEVSDVDEIAGEPGRRRRIDRALVKDAGGNRQGRGEEALRGIAELPGATVLVITADEVERPDRAAGLLRQDDLRWILHPGEDGGGAERVRLLPAEVVDEDDQRRVGFVDGAARRERGVAAVGLGLDREPEAVAQGLEGVADVTHRVLEHGRGPRGEAENRSARPHPLLPGGGGSLSAPLLVPGGQVRKGGLAGGGHALADLGDGSREVPGPGCREQDLGNEKILVLQEKPLVVGKGPGAGEDVDAPVAEQGRAVGHVQPRRGAVCDIVDEVERNGGGVGLRPADLVHAVYEPVQIEADHGGHRAIGAERDLDRVRLGAVAQGR